MRQFIGLLAALALLLVSPALAHADARFRGEGVEANGTVDGTVLFQFPKVEGVADVFVYSYSPACATSTDTPGIDLCAAVNSRCSAEPGGTMVVWFRKDVRSPANGWQRLEQACLYPGRPPERPGDIVIAVTERQLRELPIAAPALGVQPGRHALKGAETNIYAEPAEQSFTIDILGRRVDIRVTPSEYHWSYGDGTTLTTAAPGGPIPEDRWGEKTVTSHIYRQTGEVAINLATVFTGEFSVDGGPYQPIAGTARIPSTPRTLSLWRSEVKLYADDCNANPHGAGCR